VLQTPTDDDRHQPQLLVCPPTLCVGGSVINFPEASVFGTYNGEDEHETRINNNTSRLPASGHIIPVS